MATYKIYHKYSHDVEAHAEHIESALPKDRLADLVAGLQFFIEDNTEYGQNSCISEKMASYLLCSFFGCKRAEKTDWEHEVLDAAECSADGSEQGFIYDKVSETWIYGDCLFAAKAWEVPCIEMVMEREGRCGSNYVKYEEPIKKLSNEKFIKAVCAFYDTEECFKTSLTVEELLERYG